MGRAPSWGRRGRGEPSPGADVANRRRQVIIREMGGIPRLLALVDHVPSAACRYRRTRSTLAAPTA